MDLVNWNGLNLQEGIKPGQVLKLVDSQVVTADTKDTEVVEPKEIIHEVKSSETLYSVARKYGVTIKELMDWNGKKDFSVSVGDKLRIIRK
jgi:membrane-bound lytic murein transglycosylase D